MMDSKQIMENAFNMVGVERVSSEEGTEQLKVYVYQRGELVELPEKNSQNQSK